MNLFRGEVEVEIGGQKRLLKFGLNQLALYTEETGRSLSEVDFGISDLRGLIWSALATGARKRGEDFTADMWTVGDWLDDITEQDFALIMSTITNSLPKDDGQKKSRARSSGKT